MDPHASKAALCLLLALCISAPALPQDSTKTRKSVSHAANAPAALSERQRVLHALNRLTFGPRPGDVDAVLAKGLEEWIEDQLHPESIDDSALNSRLAPFATTRMSLKQIAELFPSDNVITQTFSGKRALPSDPVQRMIYSVQVARLEQQKATQAAAATASDTQAPKSASDPTAASIPGAISPQDEARATADHLLALPKDQ